MTTTEDSADTIDAYEPLPAPVFTCGCSCVSTVCQSYPANCIIVVGKSKSKAAIKSSSVLTLGWWRMLLMPALVSILD